MVSKAISGDQFESIIQRHEIVFLDFWATWCVPCKTFSTIYDNVAAKYKNILFGKVNIEQETELAETFQIRSIPHLMVFKQGIAIYSDSGSIPESTLKELVEQALRADVSDIRAQLDKDSSPSQDDE